MSQASHRGLLRLLAIVFVGLVAGASSVARDQTIIVSDDFGSCVMDLQCPPLPDCEASSFNLVGSCSADCISGGTPFCAGFADAGTPGDSWTVGGLFAAFVSPVGDTPDVQFSFEATATPTSPDELELTGNIQLYIGYQIPFQSGQVELSVFRYSGDPTVFDGLDVPSVFVLVSLGLIDADDVLFSQQVSVPDQEGNVPFDFAVDVTGVPSDEIVLFASHSGSSVDVPAVSRWGLLLLASGMLLVAGWVLTRQR